VSLNKSSLNKLEAEANYIMMSFMISTFHQTLLSLLTQENEMDRTCRMHGRNEKSYKF